MTPVMETAHTHIHVSKVYSPDSHIFVRSFTFTTIQNVITKTILKYAINSNVLQFVYKKKIVKDMIYTNLLHK